MADQHHQTESAACRCDSGNHACPYELCLATQACPCRNVIDTSGA